MRAVVAFVLVVFVVFAASRCPGVFRRSRPRPLPPGGTGKGLQCKNCSIFGSCSRRCGKGWRCKSHSKALRKQVAETSTPCSLPPLPQPHPRREDQVGLTALCGQRFVWGRVHAQRPTFKFAGNQTAGKWVGAACVHFHWVATNASAAGISGRKNMRTSKHEGLPFLVVWVNRRRYLTYFKVHGPLP